MLRVFSGGLNFLKDKKGATAIEYAFIAAGIALAIFISIFALGDDLNDTLNNGASSLQAVEDTIADIDPASAQD